MTSHGEPLLLLLLAIILPLILFLVRNGGRRASSSMKLPPGSMGFPVIGQSLGLLRAMRNNTGERWLQDRVRQYGPISKLSLFGTPTVFVTGPAANKFLFSCDALTLQQPQSVAILLGKRNMLELVGDDHRRVRGAVSQFLRPEMLRTYLGKIDGEVRRHLETNWFGHQTVTVLPLMKRLTLDIICTTLLGVDKGPTQAVFVDLFPKTIAGIWAIPMNLPFTQFHSSLKASRKIRELIKNIVREKRNALADGTCYINQDLITYLISLGGEDPANSLSEEEIVDNALTVMVAGHDTSSVAITFIIRHLAKDPATYAAVLQEQEEIANKGPDEPLTWNDLVKMKYTWRVAQEILRTIPPIFGGFRKVLRDVEFARFRIPKGWHVFWSASVTHMDAEIFKEPERFNPTRFENSSAIPPYCYVPFGAGPRICPGSEFARMEILVALHYIVTRFRWKLNCEDDSFRRDPMPSPSGGLPIQLEQKNM